MCQSYKVFINNFFILFTECDKKLDNLISHHHIRSYKVVDSVTELLTYLVDSKFLITLNVVIRCHDIEQNMNQFKSRFKLILASGGIVENKQKQILMIYKNDIWDLPKGKVDYNEDRKNAALREVKEETNIKCMIINNFSYYTYHFYRDVFNNNQIVLKETSWFHMLGTNNQLLKPELSEGILDVKWIASKHVKNIKTYPAITDLFEYYFSLI